MKTPALSLSIRLFITLSLGVSLTACQSTIIEPDTHPELVHIVKKTNEMDSLTHALPRPGLSAGDSVAINPQPRLLLTTY